MKSIGFGFVCLVAAFGCATARVAVKRNGENTPKVAVEPIVVGGSQVAVEASVPYQVAIENTFGELICGGSIIDADWVLTAAHCLEWPNKYLRIVTGTVNWTQPQAVYLVDEVRKHCRFNKPMYHNDIALIRLATPIAFNERTQPVQLARKNRSQDGDKVTLTGWGSTKVWGRFTQLLQKVELAYMAYERCLASVRKKVWLGEGHICTYTRSGKGSCHGDSGSPLVDEQQVQVGVVNWGEPCATGYPDAYASVAYYYDWIRSTMAGREAC